MDSPKPKYHVPGAYFFDGAPDTTDAKHGHGRPLGADVFLPPGDMSRSTGSLMSDVSGMPNVAQTITSKRKRPEQDVSRETTPVPGDYMLAGQIDVDGSQSTQGMDESLYYSDVEYRRQLGPSQESHTSQAFQLPLVPGRWTMLSALGNVMGKVLDFCTAGAFRGFQAGGGTVYNEIGQPVTAEASSSVDIDTLKFDLSATGSPPLSTDSFAPDGNCSSASGIDRLDSSTPTPPRRNGKRRQLGQAGEELGRNWVMVDANQRRGSVGGRTSRASLGGGSLAQPRSRTPDRRGSFRPGKSSLASGASSARRISTPISRMSTSNPSHGGQRNSQAGSPSLSTREPASFASPRAMTPLGPSSGSRRATTAGGFQTSCSPSRIPIPSTDRSSYSNGNPFARVSSASRPASALGHRSASSLGQRPGSAMSSRDSYGKDGRDGGHRRSYSAANGRDGRMRSPKKATFEEISESPRLTDEAKRLAARKLVAERESDAKMEALNAQLQAMIRQGREALGTTFEVDDGSDEGGNDADDYWMDDV